MGERPGLDEAVDPHRHVMGTHLSVPAVMSGRAIEPTPVMEHGITRPYVSARMAAELGYSEPMIAVVERVTTSNYDYAEGRLLYRCDIAVMPPGELADMLRAAYDAGREQGRADPLRLRPGDVMILCPVCGNKRCPHATNVDHACTGSNEPGQQGSAYE